jgi:hypothetical protein
LTNNATSLIQHRLIACETGRTSQKGRGSVNKPLQPGNGLLQIEDVRSKGATGPRGRAFQNLGGSAQIRGRSLKSRNAITDCRQIHCIPAAGDLFQALVRLDDPVESPIPRRHALPAADPATALPTMALLTLAESTV